jgi:hypothetical protein
MQFVYHERRGIRETFCRDDIRAARVGQRNSISPALAKTVMRLNLEFRSAGERGLKTPIMAQTCSVKLFLAQKHERENITNTL